MPLHPQITARNARIAAGSAARNAGIVPPYGNVALITTLTRLGLTDNLRLCLDAGDSASYSSGQSWLDTSGNGYDWFRGNAAAANTDDPTFNGVAGTLSSAEYWSFDGGDHFQYDTTNETWMENLHKDNAAFTLMAWVYISSFPGTVGLFGNNASANTGICWVMNTSAQLGLVVTNGAGNALIQSSTHANATNAWLCVGISVNEAVGAGGIRYFSNGVRDTDTSTYTSPSSGSASFTTQIASRGNGNGRVPNGSRMAQFMAWEGKALTTAEMTAVYQATRNRFGV